VNERAPIAAVMTRASQVATLLLSGAALAGALYLGAVPLGRVPAVGAFLDPAHGIWAVARTAELPANASLRMAGLTDSVAVKYDERGVPHIFAMNEDDLMRAFGFVVARDRVLTNHHVIDGCNAITVRSADGRTLPATMSARVDVQRDLALLAVPTDPGPVLPFRANPVRRGESVVTYGFPLAGLLAAGPTLTTGEVSALAGLANNEQHFQISAPVQQGNSGGPLLDRQGHVMGVIVSKLNAQRIAQRTGDIPQNVNFAIKGTEALGFLRRAGVEPTLRESPPTELSAAEVGERAHASAVFSRCEK